MTTLVCIDGARETGKTWLSRLIAESAPNGSVVIEAGAGDGVQGAMHGMNQLAEVPDVAVVVYDTAYPVPANFAARALERGCVPHLVTVVSHPRRVAQAVEAAIAKNGFATFRVLCRMQNNSYCLGGGGPYDMEGAFAYRIRSAYHVYAYAYQNSPYNMDRPPMSNRY